MSLANIFHYFSIIYFIVLNVSLFVLIGIDKKRAQKKNWRISEKLLLLIGFLGGGGGGIIGMQLFHHKTRHYYFYFTYLAGIFIMIFSFIMCSNSSCLLSLKLGSRFFNM